MHLPKRYGQSKVEECPFCHRQAINENPQGIPVCNAHHDAVIPELKCLCKEFLMIQHGKFGVFFSCLRCGNLNLKKALEINNIASLDAVKQRVPEDMKQGFTSNRSEGGFSRSEEQYENTSSITNSYSTKNSSSNTNSNNTNKSSSANNSSSSTNTNNSSSSTNTAKSYSKPQYNQKKELVIRSDDPDYFD